MNQKSMYKKVLSVILSVAMVAGLIVVTEPTKEVEAATYGEPVFSEDFSSNSTIKSREGSATLERKTEEDNSYLEISDFGWGNVKTDPIPVEQGKTYEFSFDMKVASVNECMNVYVWGQEWDSGGNYTTIQPEDGPISYKEGITSTEGQWKTYTFDYTPPASRTTTDYVQFFFEQQTSYAQTICFDNMIMREKQKDQVKTPVYSKDFTDGSTLTKHAGSAEQSVISGDNSYLEISKYGWGVVRTDPIAVKVGRTYELSFDIKVDEVNTEMLFYVWCEEWDSTQQYFSILTDIHKNSERVTAVTEGWKTVTITYTPSEERVKDEGAYSTDYVRFYFEQVTSNQQTICLDNIVLNDVVEVEDAVETELDVDTTTDKNLIDNGFYFTATNYDKMQLGYYLGKVLIDGVETQTYFEVNNWYSSGMYAEWASPNTSYVIPKDTVLYPVTAHGATTIQSGGTPIKVTNTLKLVRESNTADWEVGMPTLSFNKVDPDNSWYLNVDDPVMTKQYYQATVKVDGTEQTVMMEYQSGNKNFVIWPGFFENSVVPTAKFEVEAGTVLKELSGPPWSLAEGGEEVTIRRSLKIENTPYGWVETTTSSEYSTTLTFNKIDDNKHWMFYSSAEFPSTYYKGKILIDGADTEIWMERTGGNTYIYEGAFDTYPTKNLTIPKDTVLYKVDSTNSWKLVNNGARLKIADDLKVQLFDGTAYPYTKEVEKKDTVNVDNGGKVVLPDYDACEIVRTEDNSTGYTVSEGLSGVGTYEITSVATTTEAVKKDVPDVAKSETYTDINIYFNKVDASGHWYFDGSGTELTTDGSSRYYKLPVMLDGELKNVVIEVMANSKTMAIYAGFFTVYGATVPETSFEIPAGAVLTPVSSTSNWAETTGQKLRILNNLRVETATTLTKETKVLYKSGDVSNDGTIDVIDLVKMKKVQQNTEDVTTSSAGRRAADVNTSGNVDATDLRGLRKHIVGGANLTKAKADVMVDGKMPIIGFDGPELSEAREAGGYAADFITSDIYDLVKEVGVNVVVANRNEVGTNTGMAKRSLNFAEERDIKVYLNNGYVQDTTNAERPTTEDGLDKITKQYAGYSSFAGYYLYDEPLVESSSDRKGIADYKDILTLMKDTNYANLYGYINLFPCISPDLAWEINRINWVSVNGGSGTLAEDKYKDYLTAASNANMDFISYDLYLRSYKSTRNELRGFYKNMAWARDVASDAGKPFYAFVQVGNYFKKNNSSVTEQSNLTTVQEMYLEANAALAMGARGISYYSLTQPYEFAVDTDGTVDLHRSGLINVEGVKNNGAGDANYEYFNAAKKINTYIDKIDEVLMNATYQAVVSTNKEVTGMVTQWGKIASVSGDIMVGCFDYYGKEAYMIVNIAGDGGGTGSAVDAALNFTEAQKGTYIAMGESDWSTMSSTMRFTKNIPAGEAVLVVLD